MRPGQRHEVLLNYARCATPREQRFNRQRDKHFTIVLLPLFLTGTYRPNNGNTKTNATPIASALPYFFLDSISSR